MCAENLTVLAVDDDQGDAEILRRNLEQIPGYNLDFMHVPTVDEAEAALSRVGVDLTFLDYRLGADIGLDLLRKIRSSGDLRPVICLTGQGDEQVATTALQAGADDYVVKSDVSPDVLRRAIETGTAHSNSRRLEEQNRRLVRELEAKNELLKKNARHFAEMYETAHQFVDDVSHEFRTPLTVIKEFSSILYDGLAGPLAREQQDYLSIILNRVDDLAGMVDDMLDVSKLEAGLLGVARQACTVPHILEHIRTTLERKAVSRGITLEIALDDGLPEVYCDPEKIGRVIVNLTANAFKFSDEHGTVRLSARHDPAEFQVVFEVTDNGPGIHPDNVQALFERFTQFGGSARASIKGFGLGLNIAKELVHLNLGDIGVESKVGQGSTFSFTVPTAEPMRVMQRLLNRLGAVCPDTGYVSMVTARVELTTDRGLLGEVATFLRHQVGKTDLVFHTHPNAWLLILVGHQPGVDPALRRIQQAWSEENRNRPAVQLPAVDLQAHDTWRLSDQRREFLAQFGRQFAPGGLVDG